MMKKSIFAIAAVAALAQLSACSSDSKDKETVAENLDKVQQLLATNADIALAAYSDSVDTAVALKAAIAAFKANPISSNLVAAKKAWLTSREPYGQTEVYRFRLSPIDSTDYTNENGPEGEINAWPLGEGLIDYVVTGSDFGNDQVNVTDHATPVADPIVPTGNNIVNTPSITIDADLLANTATADDERDVIAGYHAIEFLLWGQDVNADGSADTETTRETGNIDQDGLLPTGGHRPLTDFTTDANADRRFTYLEVAADKLIADLEAVRDAWKPNANYRTAFVQAGTEAQALQKLTEILTGMGTLTEGELAGERMQIAFSGNSQEDEHSCFSDNTHRDIWLNAEGVSNSYYGVYAGYDSDQDGIDDVTARAVNGYGFDDLLKDLGESKLKKKLEKALTQTETDYKAIDTAARNGSPFDVQIMPANRSADSPVFKTIVDLNKQAFAITDLAEALGITDDVVDPEGSACDTSNPLVTCPE